VVKEQLGLLAQAEDAARRYLVRAPNDPAAHKLLGRILLARQRPDLAAETLAKAAEAGRADAETYDLLGRAYVMADRPADAMLNFRKAEALAPDDVGVQTRLASVRMGLGEVDTAVGDLEHSLRLAPKLPVVGEALFFAALATGDAAKAEAALAKVKAAQGETAVTGNLEGLLRLSLVDLAGAEAAFSAVHKIDPDFTPAQVNVARVRILQGRPAEAEALLDAVLSRQPAAEPALSILASVHARANRVPQAIGLLEKAVAAEPANARLRFSLGEAYLRSGGARKALDLAEADKALVASPGMLMLRAAAQRILGQKHEAQASYAALLARDPTQLDPRRQLVALLAEAGDLNAARTVIGAGIAASPREYQLYQDYALIDLKAGGLDAAQATADRLIAQDRAFALLRALKGDLFLAADRAEDAVAAYQAALAAAPSTALLTRTAGAMLRAGRIDAAIALLRDWTKANPADTAALTQLADVAIAIHRLDEAAGTLEALLRQKPHDAVALNNLAWVYQQKRDPRAQGLARQAYLLSPNAQTADTLGWILTTEGRSESGLVLLRQAYADAANDPRIRYHYAVALKDAGHREEAIRHLAAVAAETGEFREKSEARKLLDEMNRG
jgi:putative PEP-CTERM system TPR-repeat lipoprotein